MYIVCIILITENFCKQCLNVWKSWNHRTVSWKRPFGLSSLTVNPALPSATLTMALSAASMLNF